MRLLILLLAMSPIFASVIPDDCTQLIVVRTKNWSSVDGKMQTYKRSTDGSKWLPESAVSPIVVGKNGLGWGIGLVDNSSEVGPEKTEGDNKGPAGIFDLGYVFAKEPITDISLPFVQITDELEAVDDPSSKYYNRIVDRSKVNRIDWNSSEKMQAIDVYDIGVEVLHNSPPKDTKAGSAIFIHRWRTPTTGTAGCLAMELEDVRKLVFWLEKSKRPVLVQLPEGEFHRLQSKWGLPSFIGE